jgi:hypothetical protein
MILTVLAAVAIATPAKTTEETTAKTTTEEVVPATEAAK